MGWDVMIFNLKAKVTSAEEIEEDLFIPIDFDEVIRAHFKDISIDDDHREINGSTYSISYFAEEQPVGNLLMHLDGENSIYELIHISKIKRWQILDMGNGEMIDLDHPEINGYTQFKAYLKQLLSE